MDTAEYNYKVAEAFLVRAFADNTTDLTNIDAIAFLMKLVTTRRDATLTNTTEHIITTGRRTWSELEVKRLDAACTELDLSANVKLSPDLLDEVAKRFPGRTHKSIASRLYARRKLNEKQPDGEDSE